MKQKILDGLSWAIIAVALVFCCAVWAALFLAATSIIGADPWADVRLAIFVASVSALAGAAFLGAGVAINELAK